MIFNNAALAKFFNVYVNVLLWTMSKFIFRENFYSIHVHCIISGVSYDPGQDQASGTNYAIFCPSLYDAIFENEDQLNFEQQFNQYQISNTNECQDVNNNTSSLVNFINTFGPSSDDGQDSDKKEE